MPENPPEDRIVRPDSGLLFTAVAGAFLFAAVASCGEEEPAHTVLEVPPNLPLALSEAPAWNSGEAWTVAYAPTIEVGRTQTNPTQRFAGIQAALRLPDSRLVVADGTSQEIRFFGPEGGFLTRVSGPGDAPGEFRGLEGLFLLPGDSLGAFDLTRTRVAIFDLEGRFSRFLQLDGALPAGHAVGVLEGEWLVVEGRPTASGFQVGLYADTATLVRYDLDTGLADPLGGFPARERFVTRKGGKNTVGERPFGHVLSSAALGNRLYVGTGVSFEVLVLSTDGQPEGVIRRAHEPQPVTGEDRNRYVEWRTSRYRGPEAFTVRARDVLSSRATPYPKTMPAFDRMLVDQEGNLWVRDYKPPWEKEGEEWSVFDPEGHWLGTVRVPSRVEVLQVGQDFLLGIGRDVWDVERVVVFELDKPSQRRNPP